MTPQSDEDEVWRQIVASFNESAGADPADQPWPDRENVPKGEEPPPKADDEPAEPRDESGDSSEEPAEDDDGGHYVPPPPPPLPKADLVTRVAWTALFGGPAYLLLAAMLKLPMDPWIVFTAVACFIGGFVALVVRMGDGPPNDSGWDDGAVI
ncbi:prepilin peptidase [Herbidospora cretacea]|uniref:prepilin peptidase n=1 Tax=Herbidospora cretacea TaxID=28444 RepID=UPI0007737C6A|nr:prepilin peptidase [Herbidospora cretacea]